MADHGTAIEWTQAPGFKGETWNPVTGCDRVSPGCAHCYALDLAERLKRMGQKRYQRDGDPKTSGPGFGLTLHPDKLEQPRHWTKPRMVFVNSMSDLFHEEIPDEYIGQILNTILFAGRNHGHVFQVLTKRPERMRAGKRRYYSPSGLDGTGNPSLRAAGLGDVIPWLWLGVTIENRRFVDRADLLRQTPASVRFISAEPLLGPLIAPWVEPEPLDDRGMVWEDGYRGDQLDLTDIDWLIAGGESGPGHRRIDPEWARDLRDAVVATGRRCDNCEGTGQYERIASEDGSFEPYPAVCDDCRGRGRHGGAAFFFKQWGGPKPTSGGRELDGRTWSEFPLALARSSTRLNDPQPGRKAHA